MKTSSQQKVQRDAAALAGEWLPEQSHQPLAVRLAEWPDPARTFQAWSRLPGCLFLDSATTHSVLGRYSFLMAEPFDRLQVREAQQVPEVRGAPRAPWEQPDLRTLKQYLEQQWLEPRHGLPPFQGGWAGLISYDFHRALESIPTPKWEEFPIPLLDVAAYDVVLAWDHVEGAAWLIATGWPATNEAGRRCRAKQRLADCLERLASLPDRSHPLASDEAAETPASAVSLAAGELAPGYATEKLPGLVSNFSAAGYREMIRRGIEAIAAGDVFQVNLAQRLLYPASLPAPVLYAAMRERNPAPFAGYFDGGDYQIVSASPERLVSLRDRQVEARPIKGTLPRLQRPEADLYLAQQLLGSEKDRAENIMIVDLLRNDLSPVCEAASVQVTQLCEIENYAYVQHLVSAVTGQLRDGFGAVELLASVFPGGSITGAPKVRAMELISELEGVARGAYCGSLGYFGCDGSADFSILIRTVTASRGWWQLPVGGGIVADSDPEREYQETWHKARGLLAALPASMEPRL